MHRPGTILFLGLAITVVLSGTAGAKIMVELSPSTATPGGEVQVTAAWGDPVGPVRHFRIFLVASKKRLGPTAEIPERFGRASSRPGVLALDAAPERAGRLRATFTVPQVPNGGYGVYVCVSKRQCFSYGRFRVTGSAVDEYVPETREAVGSPSDTGRGRALEDRSSSAPARVVAAAALVVALGCAALLRWRIGARRAAA
ncbi:MAG: hypothetical protein ACRDJV_03630 [Actinomycetota bacterium]